MDSTNESEVITTPRGNLHELARRATSKSIQVGVYKMPHIRSCSKCSFETSEALPRCPNCGSRLQSAKKVRLLGGLLLVIGTFLVLFMSILGVYLGSLIS